MQPEIKRAEGCRDERENAEVERTKGHVADHENIEHTGARDRDDAFGPGEKASLHDQRRAERGDEYAKHTAAAAQNRAIDDLVDRESGEGSAGHTRGSTDENVDPQQAMQTKERVARNDEDGAVGDVKNSQGREN
jgi:hypothetical protein